MNTTDHLIPTRLRELAGEATWDKDKEDACLTVKLRCPRCNGTTFTLLLNYRQVHIGADAGKTLPFDPVWVFCSTCRYCALLFDSRLDGHNGFVDTELLGIPHEKVQPWQGAREANYGVRVTVNFDTSVALVDTYGTVVPDAFHWIGISAEWSDATTEEVIDFETA